MFAPGPTPTLSHHPLWNGFFPSLKICKCVKVGYSQPLCSLFSLLCCRIWGGKGSRMHPSSGPWLRSHQTCIAVSSTFSAHWGQLKSPALEVMLGCMTFAPYLTPQSANSLVSTVIMAAGEDTCKVKPVRSLQSNVQEKWQKHSTSFQKVTSSSLLCPDLSLWWKIQSTWVWWMNQCLCSMCSIQL